MCWYRGEADEEDDNEPSIARQPRHGAVVEVRALELERFAAEEVSECKPCANYTCVSTMLSCAMKVR